MLWGDFTGKCAFLVGAVLLCAPNGAAAADNDPVPPTPQIGLATPPAGLQIRTLIGDGSLHPLGVGAVLQIGSGDPSSAEADDDATCLTQAVYYEARSENLAGQEAVAQVVINRSRDPHFPSTVCGVVFERTGAFGTCQFSFACDGSTDRRLEPDAWDRAQQVAVQALHGFTFQPLKSALHYHADYVSPYWSGSLIRIRQIGHHIFYQ